MYQFMLYHNAHSDEAEETLVKDAKDMNAMFEEDEYASAQTRKLQDIWGGVLGYRGIGKLWRQAPARVVYEYDLGDGWEHEIEFEGEVENDLKAVTLEGAGHPAVEDCGGPHGWERYKVSICS